MTQSTHVIYVLSVTMSSAIAEKYSSLFLGVRNSRTSLYGKVAEIPIIGNEDVCQMTYYMYVQQRHSEADIF